MACLLLHSEDHLWAHFFVPYAVIVEWMCRLRILHLESQSSDKYHSVALKAQKVPEISAPIAWFRH